MLVVVRRTAQTHWCEREVCTVCVRLALRCARSTVLTVHLACVNVEWAPSAVVRALMLFVISFVRSFVRFVENNDYYKQKYVCRSISVCATACRFSSIKRMFNAKEPKQRSPCRFSLSSPFFSFFTLSFRFDFCLTKMKNTFCPEWFFFDKNK